MGKPFPKNSTGQVYSIKTVCAEIGLLPVTLRAWEARYRIVTPSRSKSNYRLYTERDAALLRWVKHRVDAGIPIRLVAAEASRLRRAGKQPEASASPVGSGQSHKGGDPSKSADCLYDALTAHRESVAERCLADALTRFDLAALCLDVMTPCLWHIGDAWERGAIRIATEHFASNYLRGRLLAWFQSAPNPRRGPLILVGCAPQELHDIGSLMLALFLRTRRYRVEFLGQDLNLDDLCAYIREVHPAFVCLSAGAESPARRLIGFQSSLNAVKPHPLLGFGGRAFNRNPLLQKEISGVFLGESLPEAISRIQSLLEKHPQ
jgi:DNA-binding transcriptional MerR regulator